MERLSFEGRRRRNQARVRSVVEEMQQGLLREMQETRRTVEQVLTVTQGIEENQRRLAESRQASPPGDKEPSLEEEVGRLVLDYFRETGRWGSIYAHKMLEWMADKEPDKGHVIAVTAQTILDADRPEGKEIQPGCERKLRGLADLVAAEPDRSPEPD